MVNLQIHGWLGGPLFAHPLHACQRHPNCLKVTRGPATISPIDLVMMVLLIFEFQEKLSGSRLAYALYALRMAARKETKDLMWKTEHMGYYLIFLDRLERLGEGALGPNSAVSNDGPVAMDMDPPAKRQWTGSMFFSCDSR